MLINSIARYRLLILMKCRKLLEEDFQLFELLLFLLFFFFADARVECDCAFGQIGGEEIYEYLFCVFEVFKFSRWLAYYQN